MKTIGLTILIILACFVVASPTVRQPKHTPLSTREYEEILHRVLTYSEFAEESKQLCAPIEFFTDPETEMVLWARCKVRDETFSLEYKANGLVLGIVEEDGSTIYDQGENGIIDCFGSPNNQKVAPKNEWQERFNKRIQSIFEKNPRLLQLGFFIFIYINSRECARRS